MSLTRDRYLQYTALASVLRRRIRDKKAERTVLTLAVVQDIAWILLLVSFVIWPTTAGHTLMWVFVIAAFAMSMSSEAKAR
jgi:hypothetical protein